MLQVNGFIYNLAHSKENTDQKSFKCRKLAKCVRDIKYSITIKNGLCTVRSEGGGGAHSAKLFWAQCFSVKGGRYPPISLRKTKKTPILAFFDPFFRKIFGDFALGGVPSFR